MDGLGTRCPIHADGLGMRCPICVDGLGTSSIYMQCNSIDGYHFYTAGY